MSQRRPQRLREFNYIGCHRYFLTMCTRNREPLFTNDDVATTMSSLFVRTAARQGFAVLAYTVMPDHVHLLVEGRDDHSDFRRFTTILRRATSAACWHQAPHGLWQDGYFERTLRQGEGTQACIDYILNNPVRAGLVERATDYAKSWSVTMNT